VRPSCARGAFCSTHYVFVFAAYIHFCRIQFIVFTFASVKNRDFLPFAFLFRYGISRRVYMPTLEQLKQKSEKAKREALRLEAQISKQARAEDTRRKVLIGAACINLCEKDEGFKLSLTEHLNTYIERNKDRELLGLPKKEKTNI
jgi:hypothetical protein